MKLKIRSSTNLGLHSSHAIKNKSTTAHEPLVRTCQNPPLRSLTSYANSPVTTSVIAGITSGLPGSVGFCGSTFAVAMVTAVDEPGAGGGGGADVPLTDGAVLRCREQAVRRAPVEEEVRYCSKRNVRYQGYTLAHAASRTRLTRRHAPRLKHHV